MRYDLLLCRAVGFGMTPLAAALSEFESVNNIDEVTSLLLKWCKKKEKTWIIPKPYLEFRITKEEQR